MVKLTDEQARNLKQAIRWCAEQYGDETRSEWFDVDDECRRICWELEEIIDEQIGGRR